MSKPSLVLSTLQKLKDIENLQLNNNQNTCNFINIPLGSVFVKKFNKKQNISTNSSEKLKTEDNDQIQQNQLSKFKHYSRILESSSKLSKFHLRETKYVNQQQKDSFNCSPSNELQKLHEKQEKQIEVIQQYYSSKNQRKNKVLNKAKQLGKNNFYKFLKQTAILQNNRHFHRFHEAKAIRKGSLPQKEQKQSEKQQIAPMIFSFKPNKDEVLIQKMVKKIQLPDSPSIRQIKKKLKYKTQSSVEYKSLGVTKHNNDNIFSINDWQNKKTKKGIIRSLTQINEKIRKNRSSKQKDNLLFKEQESNKIQNLQNFVQKWKYKSLLNPQRESFPEILHKKNKVSSLIKSPEVKDIKEMKKLKNYSFFKRQSDKNFQNKSQIMIRHASFVNENFQKKMGQETSFKIKKIVAQGKQQ